MSGPSRGFTLYQPDLSKIAISIKTFLRDAQLEYAMAGILYTMPEAQIIVADDGEPSARKYALYESLRKQGHLVIELPFDSGFGRKSNEITAACHREYILIASDDFDFRPLSVRQGIEKLVAVLDGDSALAIASGRVNGNRYEGYLRDYGDRIVEEYITLDRPQHVNGVTYHRCNLTVNYSLIRAGILGPEKIHWDGEVKIGGGEHGAFFVDVMRAGHGVAWVPGVDIREQETRTVDPRYAVFRGRARQPGRPCFARRGIKEYTCFGGSIEHSF